MGKPVKSKRFSRVSDYIDIRKLERETHRLLLLGFMIAIVLHGTAGTYAVFRTSRRKVVKPVTMELVVRRPRITKPFEISERGYKKRDLHKKEFVYRIPVDEIQTKTPLQLESLESEPKQDYSVETQTQEVNNVFITEKSGSDMTAERKPEKFIYMNGEMIDLKDLNYGKYKAMVIRNAHNIKDVRGFVHIATVWGTQLQPPDALKRSVLNLADAVSRYTDITAYLDPHLMLDSQKLFTMPFIYITADKAFELTKIEAENLGRYLRNGGFAVIDNGSPQFEYSQAEASLRQMLRDALGKDARFLPIPNHHPLYHCFFNFDDGPPQGNEVQMARVSTRPMGSMFRRMSKIVIYLEGIWIDNRLVAIYSDKGYAHKWKDFSNNTPQIRMGVNMIVFALTQEDGLTHRNMSHFSSSQ